MGHAEIVSALLAAGATVGLGDKDGYTPLMRASYRGHVDVVSLLLASDAVIDRQDRAGATPLHYAAAYGLLGLMQLLLRADGSPGHLDADDCAGNTPLHYAYAFRRADAIDMLAERGADDTLANAMGQAPRDAAGDQTIRRLCRR